MAIRKYPSLELMFTNQYENSLRNLVIEKSREPFDLENGKVLRIYLFSKSKNDNVLLISIHHISTDGRSVEVMMDELGKFYESEVKDDRDSLLPSETLS